MWCHEPGTKSTSLAHKRSTSPTTTTAAAAVAAAMTLGSRRPSMFAVLAAACCLFIYFTYTRSPTYTASYSHSGSPLRVSAENSASLGGASRAAAAGTSNDQKPYGRNYAGRSKPAEINRVANATLGFGAIFVVGLPEASHKRDALELMGDVTGLRISWVDGVKGEQVPDKALPYGMNRSILGEGNVGSWRAHMNAIRR